MTSRAASPLRAPHPRRARSAVLRAALAVLACGAPGAVWAQPAPASNGIFTCVDNQGRRLTADRPIPQCADREQQVLNRDGSLRRIHPPTLTAEERAAQEARERQQALQRAAHAEAVRRDRNLLTRYQDEGAHERAREAALDTVRVAMRNTASRLRDVAEERKPLLAEAEFYIGRDLPARLRAQINANDAATAALNEATAQQQAEVGRINRLFDVELERLRRLWAGAMPGSMGPLPSPQQVANGRGPALAPGLAPTSSGGTPGR